MIFNIFYLFFLLFLFHYLIYFESNCSKNPIFKNPIFKNPMGEGVGLTSNQRAVMFQQCFHVFLIRLVHITVVLIY